MKPSSNSPSHSKPDFELSLFCGRVGDAWRIHVWPGWLPAFLRNCFDAEGEAYPVYIDLEELDREMTAMGVSYRRTENPLGGTELYASGRAATLMAQWLSQSLGSACRVVNASDDGEASSDSGQTG